MEESSEKIHPRKLKSFVRHVCVVAKRHKEREVARAELEEHIKKLRRFSSKKREMDEQLTELHRKVNLVLDKEAKLLGMERGESAASKELMKNVSANKDKIGHINDSIDGLKDKLDDYVQVKTKRERMIMELEKRISSKVGKKKDISSLRKKLKTLEVSYKKLKMGGVDVSRIEAKIDGLKLRLMI